jgi:ABC-type multidrug transport system fused ATPase/permease subunit
MPISIRRIHEVAAERFGISREIRFEREIRLEGVSFRYPSAEHDALQDVDLSIRHGKIVALVGPTGAGKSTIADIVLGLLEPTRGRVLVDDYDLAESARPWQRLIGYVPQDIYLADDTLAANVAFGYSPDEADPERIARALALAELDGLVSRLPDGVETRVGERGVRLSGGERQRLGLARALYLQPPMLVLDEATSALDNSTEARISSTFRSLHGSVTMLVIAHRLSTVRESDSVVFVDHGRVIGDGPFRELERALPAFAHMVELAALPE